MNVQEWNENKLSSATHAHQDNKNQIQWIGHKQRKKNTDSLPTAT